MRADRELAVMGTHGNVVVHGDAPERGVARAIERLTELEQRWSRFRPDSEISRINAAGGRPVNVSPETVTLLFHAVAAWYRTDGLFDPTVGSAMVRHGYDRDFATVGSGVAVSGDRPGTPEPARGCAGIELDITRRRVRVPNGTSLDVGGLGKGLAADLVAAEVLALGNTGVLINIGGDMRMAGTAPNDGWIVAIEHPRRPGEEWFRMSLPEGAVATSSTLRRRWVQGDVSCHHVMDPRTGAPATGSTVAVTTVGRTACWAEVVATALLLADEPATAPLAEAVEYVALRADGTRAMSEGMAAVIAA